MKLEKVVFLSNLEIGQEVVIVTHKSFGGPNLQRQFGEYKVSHRIPGNAKEGFNFLANKKRRYNSNLKQVLRCDVRSNTTLLPVSDEDLWNGVEVYLVK